MIDALAVANLVQPLALDPMSMAHVSFPNMSARHMRILSPTSSSALGIHPESLVGVFGLLMLTDCSF